MFELNINNTDYPLNFGFGFVRDINPKITKKIDGVNGRVEQLGLRFRIAGVIDGDIEDLVEIIALGNKHAEGEKIKREEIEIYLENPETDISEVFEKVLDFLSKANCTKQTVENLQKTIEEEKAKAAAKNEQN